jgi:MoxR-like ATPase
MNYWVVGAAHGNTDVSNDFLTKGIWYDGYAEDGDDRNKNILDEVVIGDLLLMKSSATKGANHAITFTKLKGVGKVISKDNYYSFKVNWYKIKELPIDFDGISYRKTIEPLRDDEMLEFAQRITEKEKIKMIIDLLKYKNQIILQGPPGTGKTRQAKLIAEELTSQKIQRKPNDIILDFIKNFVPIEEIRTNEKNILNKFQEKFPKEELEDLTLEKYCIGLESKNSFCYWLEYPMWFLGRYSGFSNKFRIYFNKQKESFIKTDTGIKDLSDAEAMKVVAEYLNKLVNEKYTEVESSLFGLGFQCKVLNSYYPDEYFPILKETHLDNALKLIGVNNYKGNFFQKNKVLVDFLNTHKGEVDINNFDLMRFLYTEFGLEEEVEETNETHTVKTGDYQIIQFHPAYSYEDFVRGIVAETTESGNVSYQVENKILADFAQKATDNPNGNYVLIIDEINRANLPSVLGELIYALEYRNEPVTSMYEYEGGREITLPKNLYIIGTMNTADRSVGHIDYAIRRRFAFVDILPDENVIQNAIAKTLFNEIKTLFGNEFLSPDFKAKDVMIGHSYFLVKDENELRIKLEFEIKPILREYLKDGIFLETANEKIELLNV